MSIETLIQKSKIDRQFKKTEKVSCEDVEIPVHIVTHENPKDENFIFFAPGYGMLVEEMYKDHTLHAIHAEKRNILTFDPPPTGWEFTLTPEEKEKIKDCDAPPEEIRMAKSLIRVLEDPAIRAKIGENKIDVAAHSRGLGYTTIAALLRPDLFRTIGAYGGAGLIGKDSVPSLLWRTIIGQQHFRWWNPIDWGAEATDLEKLSREVATDRKRTGRNFFIKPFIRATEADVLKVYLELKAKKEAALKRGIEEYAAPTKEQQKVMGEVADAAGKSIFHYFWPGKKSGILPNTRRIKEIGGLANLQIDKALVRLSKDLGVGVVLAYGESDPVFQKHRHEVYTMSPEFRDAGIMLVSVNGGHGSLGERPVLTRTLMGAIEAKNNQIKETQTSRKEA